MTDWKIYEDAEAKYASIQKSISSILESAYSVLYANSSPLSPDQRVDSGHVFALNPIPDYPRQEVMAVPMESSLALNKCSAQISKDGKMGYLLVEAKDGEEVLGLTKGLYADIPKVKG